jgi:hypothetical protein
MTKECTCGDTGYHWLPDENQAEANCWECYYKAFYKPCGDEEEMLPL